MKKIKVFEDLTVGLGAQNRPQDAPKEDKKRHRKQKNEKIQKLTHQELQKELQKVLTPFGPEETRRRGKGDRSSLVGRGPQERPSLRGKINI